MYNVMCKDLMRSKPAAVIPRRQPPAERYMAKSSPPAAPHRPAAEPAPARQDRTGPVLPPLRVRYYRRMHLQRVYGVTVSWHHRDARRPAASGHSVLLRLLMAGAQVVPSEQPLDPANVDAHGTFYVTPLARGWLRGERLEVLVDGRKVQEIPLATNVTSQRMTWVLLMLTVLVPWFLLSYCKYAPLSPGKKEEAEIRKAGDAKEKLTRHITPGQVLEHRLKENFPPVLDVVSEKVPDAEDYLSRAPRFIADIYDTIWTETELKKHPVAYYAAAVLLLLTLLSWFMHREKRKRRTGMPVPLPTASAPMVVG
jgi:hypothetical protein